ncbi:hypothetical protein DERP_009537 [Dermatophagoides pteronyssinus]|uniref:Uncharacterized protein n=1 Tax=Dermatophagoides pteronyssinus TaxID=6956 RepID=A0ABQ8IUF5_DERPT|nr:hypothetical protein DERP_009537 [Dermatophagoides pteronyssinus]
MALSLFILSDEQQRRKTSSRFRTISENYARLSSMFRTWIIGFSTALLFFCGTCENQPSMHIGACFKTQTVNKRLIY